MTGPLQKRHRCPLVRSRSGGGFPPPSLEELRPTDSYDQILMIVVMERASVREAQ